MDLKKALWYTAGMLCLVLAYIGFILPGIPFSIPLVGAAYCFAKSSEKMHDWLYNHPWFGEFLTNFTEKKIFPTKAKYMMVAMMSTTVVIMWFTTHNLVAVFWAALFMASGAWWTWRLPGSEEEWEKRQNKSTTK